MDMKNRIVFRLRDARRLVASLVMGAASAVFGQSPTDGSLKIEPIVAYNFVVDSNVESPSSYSPSAAHLGVKVKNTGSVPFTTLP